MAKKPKTPQPPRKVQAPQQRSAPRQGMDADKQKKILYGVALAGLAGLGIAMIVIFATGGNSKAGNAQAISATMKAAGCTLTTSKAAPSAQHIPKVTDPVKYSTFPPVSGKHYGIPSIWGNYTQAVDPRQAVHNEEHGGIVVWLGPDVSASDRSGVADFYDSSPNGILVTPIDDKTTGITFPPHKTPGSTLFLTAWTTSIKGGNITGGKNVIAACPHYDAKAFAAFRDEFRGKGPERFPVSGLTPGS